MDTLASRARRGRGVMIVGIAVNIFLALAKILGGWFGRSHEVKDSLMEGGFQLSDVTVHIEPD